ncbi:Utp21 specific WD40 associated putative domain-containing protein [Lipomyces japonicus]|uniref:Utp21 specific WD40 associated putative domain-containing protein n=1 Tax=Lipomyces japonicus TaxID=56871 RepID=UPI0034CD4BF6
MLIMPSLSSTTDLENYKRRRVVTSSNKGIRYPSKIFSPFRSIGHVTNNVPFSVSSLGQTFIVTTVVGTSFQIYDAATLHLLFVSTTETDYPINAISAQFHYVYAVWGTTLGMFHRGKLQYKIDSGAPSHLQKLLVFGDYICTSSEDAVYIFRFTSPNKQTAPELYTTLTLPPGSGEIVKIIHPHAYLNKIVIATSSYLLVFNVRTGKLVFQSQPFQNIITDIDVAPVLDVVGVAFDNGSIIAIDIKHNKSVFEISCRQKISSITFRTDGNAHLAAGTVEGDIYFYDINRKRRVHILRDVHSAKHGGVSSVHFLNGQPVFITSGGDNKLKEYVFDPELSASSQLIISPPRLLRSRGGHSESPVVLFFTEESGHFILSASKDRSLWQFSLRKDAQSREFSQREKALNNKRVAGVSSSLREKFPEITAMSYEPNREGEWENIITAHEGQAFARTWDGRRGIVGRWQLRTSDKGTVSSVSISSCGNFGIIGSTRGAVDVFNLQSGIHRKKYKSHRGSITGIALDALNKNLITAGSDGELQSHDFKKANVRQKLNLLSPISSIKLHSSTNLLAVALESNNIVVVDIATMRIVRELHGHSQKITDFDFSSDGRWIVSASEDLTIRTWDLPSGFCIDAVKVSSIVRSLRISGNDEWLATAHDNEVGINLWANRTLFKHVSLSQISDDEIRKIEMPSVSGELGSSGGVLEGAFEIEEDDLDAPDSGVYVSPGQLYNFLLSFSNAPRSKYLTLVNLDVIKQRNKPKEAPKTPVQAPFFLSLGLTQANESIDSTSEENGKPNKSVSTKLSESAKLLINGNTKNDYTAFIDYFKSLSPSSTDLEIRSLHGLEGNHLTYFVSAMVEVLQSRREYELVNAWMAMFLFVYGDEILQTFEKKDEVIDILEKWYELQHNEKKRFDDLLGYCNGVINFLKIE